MDEVAVGLAHLAEHSAPERRRGGREDVRGGRGVKNPPARREFVVELSGAPSGVADEESKVREAVGGAAAGSAIGCAAVGVGEVGPDARERPAPVDAVDDRFGVGEGVGAAMEYVERIGAHRPAASHRHIDQASAVAADADAGVERIGEDEAEGAVGVVGAQQDDGADEVHVFEDGRRHEEHTGGEVRGAKGVGHRCGRETTAWESGRKRTQRNEHARADSGTPPLPGAIQAKGAPARTHAATLPRPISPPMFVSFEGLDGSGKTTQLDRLEQRLRAHGRAVTRVREPGGTDIGERVRALLLDPDLDIAPRAELLLFAAARAHLCETVVRPALGRGEVVLADRFFDSTTAYQTGGRGVLPPSPPPGPQAPDPQAPGPFMHAEAFHRYVTGDLVPARTFLLRLDPDAALARRAGRGADRMEASSDAFFRRVAAAYDTIAAASPSRIHVLDASQPAGVLASAIWADLAPRLGLSPET